MTACPKARLYLVCLLCAQARMQKCVSYSAVDVYFCMCVCFDQFSSTGADDDQVAIDARQNFMRHNQAQVHMLDVY